jgi:putative Mg2+ transporter-C (MgtC) family protein
MSEWQGDPILYWPGVEEAAALGVRLVLAALLGGLLGLERQLKGKAAGMRTHMLVCLGSALFVAGALQAGSPIADVTRVIQGVATGIGFVGGGAILKSADDDEVKGLTTAANIWLTGAVGMAVGTGRLVVPVLGTLLALAILSLIRRIEARWQS